MKVLQINIAVNKGSTGRIAEDIGATLLSKGHESYIAAAETSQDSQSQVIPVGHVVDRKIHGLQSRLFDRHGFGSEWATKKLIQKIKLIDPDLIHLHNIHGYYLNIQVLFCYLKQIQKPVIWTFHDCWPITGHCAYFDRVDCKRWEVQCYECPLKKRYPSSWLLDQSKRNYLDKKSLFNGLNELLIVTPSNWLAGHIPKSFLKNYPVKTVNNGIDLEVFKPTMAKEVHKKYDIKGHIILGVASVWDKRKGLDDFVKLNELIPDDYQIVLVGLNSKQIKQIPDSIIAIERTENIIQLAELYAAATVFVNPTYVDNFPTTNLESLACGTPVITYHTGGSAEAIDERTGIALDKGDVKGIVDAIRTISQDSSDYSQELCRNRAERLYLNTDRYLDYLDLYNELLKKSNLKKTNSEVLAR